MIHKKPKFKVGDEVVYHAGNWKWIVLGIFWDEKGRVVYVCECNDNSCEHDDSEDKPKHLQVHDERNLIDYETWCAHTDRGTCKICCN